MGTIKQNAQNYDIAFASSGISFGDKIKLFDKFADLPRYSTPARLNVILLAVCSDGKIDVTIDMKPFSLVPSSLMVLRPGHIINSYSVSDDFKGFFIALDGEILNEALPSFSKIVSCAIYFLNNPLIRLTRQELTDQLQFFNLIRRKIDDTHIIYHENIVRSLCESMFYETLSLYSSHIKDESNVSRRKMEMLFNFVTLVEQNYRQHRDVAFYADSLCVTPKHLSSVLKETSTRTAHQWINSYVILEAKLLLKDQSMSIKEVSSRLNFPNQSFFGKYFKKETGLSPREYIEKG
ncbi:MAG: helix-turn-helix domain-containing protein [Muribaculaceae bacterium]|nr:helix-turn-helix domain-containing protein [Muribaculaceae bacterium]